MMRSTGTRGSVLMIAMVVVLIVAGLSAAFISFSYSQSKTTFAGSEGESSLNTSEAGIDDAVNKLNAIIMKTWKGDAATTTASLTPTPTATGDYIISGDVPAGLDFYSLNVGTVTGTIKDPVTGILNGVTRTKFSGSVNRGAYDVTIEPAYYGVGEYTITAWGSHGKEKKGLVVIVAPGPTNSLGDYGLVGKVTLTATSSNVFVDSFKSSLGTWESQAKDKTVNGQTYKVANENGNLGSNGDITVNNGIVFGSATPGPKSTVTTGKATITGSTTPAGADLVIPSFTYTPPGSSPVAWPKGMVTLGDGTATPTTYHYSTAVTSGSGAGITIKGAVILYVDGNIGMNASEPLLFADSTSSLTIYQGSGDITLNGQTYAAGVTPKASNLQIHSASAGDIKFNGGSEVYASVYAPDAAFRQTGSSVFFGKMVANTIDIGGNMSFHRDEDVTGGPTSAPTFRIKSFTEAH